MKKIVHYLILIFILPLLYSYIAEFYRFLFIFNKWLGIINFFNIGIAAYILLYVFFISRKIIFIETFEHELCHTVMAWLTFQKVVSFNANASGSGNITHTSDNFLIALAPYFFPIFTIPLIIIRPFIISSVQEYFNFFIGFTLAFHYMGLLKEFRPVQPDIKKSGFIFSIVVSLFFNLIFTVISMAFASGAYKNVWLYLKDSAVKSVVYYKSIASLF